MALLKLRRHTYFLDCDTIEVKKVSAGRFEINVDNGRHVFIVVGGRASGGAAHEWFVYYPELLGDIWHPLPQHDPCNTFWLHLTNHKEPQS